MAEYSASYATAARDQARALFSHVMWLVALTAGAFALGCYAGRDLSTGWSVACFVVGFGTMIALNFARRSSGGAAVALLLLMGLFFGLGLGPVLGYYTATSPRAVWQAAGATALFVAGFGAYGYATRRDLTLVGRAAFFALVGLIIFAVILIFAHFPGADLVYALLGLVVFAGLTMYDFQRLRRSRGLTSAPVIAASIFLDALNVFLFFLRLFSGGRN